MDFLPKIPNFALLIIPLITLIHWGNYYLMRSRRNFKGKK